MTQIRPVSRGGNPYPQHGVSLDAYGVRHYDNLPASLLDMLWGWAERTPDAEALVEIGGIRLTYRHLWDRAARVAGGLRGRGVGTGDRVAVRYPAGVDWVLAFWGTLLAGAIPVAVNIRSAPPEIELVLADSGAVVDLAPGTPLPDGMPYEAPPAAPATVAALFYTSGTTGRPKGVPTTHEAFLTNCENMIRALDVTADAGDAMRTLISVPLFHVTGCNSQLLTALYVGGASVIMPALNPAALVACLAEERISFLVTVPAVYALLLRRGLLVGADVSSVRWAAYGGAPIAASLVGEIKAAFPDAHVINGFGMTETASLVTVLPDADVIEHADSVGYCVPSVELAVESISDDVGELLAKGANITAGYWQRADATAAAFVDGWLRTGDIVRVDDAGRVRIVDRAKDIIIRGGENISSVEVEDALAGAPGIAEAAAIGVPDEVMGEKVGAVVVAAPELVGGLDVGAIIAHVSTRIADFKVPQYLCVWEGPLPRNPGGKVLKAQLRAKVTWGEPLR
jgi:acyl-CoA synthetase (AMP-forming)/AMP-acid ligase II